jgi:hypothetical protein
MGEPATRSDKDRLATRTKAAAVVRAVIDDEEFPLSIGVFTVRDVESLVFELCAEIVQLAKERDELEANAVRMREYRFALEGIATDGEGKPL